MGRTELYGIRRRCLKRGSAIVGQDRLGCERWSEERPEVVGNLGSSFGLVSSHPDKRYGCFVEECCQLAEQRDETMEVYLPCTGMWLPVYPT